MKIVILAVVIATSVPLTWAQKVPRGPLNRATSDIPNRHQVRLGIRSFTSHPHLTPAQTPAPATGVALCYIDPNGLLSGAFINTATIPSGSTITGGITLLDDNSSIDFTGVTLNNSLAAGTYVQLPTISNFGELWLDAGAALDLTIQIQPPHGATSQVDCVVLAGEVLKNSDLAGSEPIISAVTTSVATSKDLLMVLNGYFTSDAAQVVLTDLYSIYVVPANAVTIVSGSQINVDLSQIPGMDLTTSDTMFVTVSQDGYSDTVDFRYLPGAPGFNLAPQ